MSDFQNLKIVFSYDGSKFNGSQTQPTKDSVQDFIESTLNSIGIPSKIILSGRTDKGVHATSQVANFFIPSYWIDLDKLKSHLNFKLKPHINIQSLVCVSDKFHSRFSAKRRLYRYVCSTNPFCVFQSNYVHFIESFNLNIIKKASYELCGTFDFEYFCKSGSEPKSTIRTIHSIKIYSPKKNIFIISIEGNSFLRSQIRMIVDFLLKIGSGKLSIDDLKSQLKKVKIINTKLAPASGLYLAKIFYN